MVTANFTGYTNGGGTVAPMEWVGVGGFDVAGLDGNSSCPYSSLVTTAVITTTNADDLILAFFVDTSGAESIAAGDGSASARSTQRLCRRTTRANVQSGGRELNPVARVFGRSTPGLAVNFAGKRPA